MWWEVGKLLVISMLMCVFASLFINLYLRCKWPHLEVFVTVIIGLIFGLGWLMFVLPIMLEKWYNTFTPENWGQVFVAAFGNLLLIVIPMGVGFFIGSLPFRIYDYHKNNAPTHESQTC